ncbi:MAG: M50 family metallopeptidase [Rhodospirillales bacterium]
MHSHVRLGRIFGVEIGLHYSWILIAALITFSLAAQFQVMHPEWPEGIAWAAALLTAILFFITLIAHELAHSLVARSRGLPVLSITLFALGGVARAEKESPDAKTEFLVAIAGPITSALIAGGCLAAAWANGWTPFDAPATPALSILVWLGYINGVLAAFNMIPGFPLDGGRVLRAIMWGITGNAARSLRLAAQAGRAVAVLLMAAGIVQFFAGAGFGGLWMSFIGWFLLEAARSSYARAYVEELLRGLRVRDLMVRDCPSVGPRYNLRAFVEDELLRTGRQCFMVTDNDRVVGLIGPREVKDVPRPQWIYHTVADVMSPIDQLLTINPDVLVTEALETMGRENVSQLPVAFEGRVEGVISRASVLGFLETRRELHV